MNWLDNMNRAVDYIEDTLKQKTDYAKIAQSACCSVYHFQRVFTFITGLTLSEYIRRRRMTLAAFELQNSAVKVIDLAMDYGYDSPEAFSRTFQSLHGITPTAARSPGANVKAFPRISFQITVKGVDEMNYRIIEKPAFQVYGIEGIFDIQNGENLKTIPQFWTDSLQNGEYAALVKSAGCPSSVNAVCGYRKMEGTQFPYMLCIIKTPLSDTAGYTVVDIPKATWAVFTNEPHLIEETSNAVQQLTSRVYTDWLPTADYVIDEGYEFEMYYSDFQGRYYEEAWYRILPKNS